MNFADLQAKLGSQPWFDLPTALQISGERRQNMLTQLSRWNREGKLISIRRGLYTIADPYRRASLSLPQLANRIYSPSYLTGIWCLGYYGLVPERVHAWTSATTRTTRNFDTSLGEFRYAKLKHSLFRGFSQRRIQKASVLIADPEKAVCDYFYLTPGEWNPGRLLEMRFQNFQILDFEALFRVHAHGFPPRVISALHRLRQMAEEQEDEEIEI